MSNKYWADKTDGVDEIAAEDFNLAFSNLEKDISSNIGGLKSHRTAEILDHPDGSVTGEKLADGSVTRLKLGKDVTDEIDSLKGGGFLTVSKKSDLPENASNSAVYIVLGDTEDNNGVYLYLNDEWYKLSMTKASEASADTTAVVGKAIAGKAIVGT